MKLPQVFRSLCNTLVLSLALLMSQMVIAAHDIACMDGEHEQTCEIYFTSDHSASNVTNHYQPAHQLSAESPDRCIGLASPTLVTPLYHSRAPPHHL